MSLDPRSAPSNKFTGVKTRPLFAGTKAVFFDLDDTLCAYWDAAKTGLRLAFSDHPIPGVTTDELIAFWGDAFRSFAPTIKDTHWYPKYLESGESTRIELMRRTLENAGVFDDDLATRLSHTYYVERHAALELFPESRSVLEALHSNFKLGLITNGPADIQRQEIETLGIGHFFDVVLIEGELGVGKPNPLVMDQAEVQIGYSGSEVLFVGNSFAHDVEPARAAGWHQAWIRRNSDVSPTSRSTEPDCLPEGATPPDLTITNLRELLPALGIV